MVDEKVKKVSMYERQKTTPAIFVDLTDTSRIMLSVEQSHVVHKEDKKKDFATVKIFKGFKGTRGFALPQRPFNHCLELPTNLTRQDWDLIVDAYYKQVNGFK